MNAELLEAVAKLCGRFKGALDQAEREGKIDGGDRAGTLMSSLLRALDHISELPDDRDLTGDEVEIMQAALLQVATASLVRLNDLPFPGIAVIVAAFDTWSPQ